MRFRRWLSKLIFGFDIIEFKQEVTQRMDTICTEVATLMELREVIPPEEWAVAVQNAIGTHEARIDLIGEIIDNHQEAFDYIFKEGNVIPMTDWGNQNNKDIN